MAANDGPVPIRTLAHAARLMREARQLASYGINAGEPTLDYRRLLARVREVTGEVRRHGLLRDELQQAGVTVYEHAGTARFVDPHVIECDNGPRVRAANVIVAPAAPRGSSQFRVSSSPAPTATRGASRPRPSRCW